jgi:DNA polymerase III epsilon subunit-like protein
MHIMLDLETMGVSENSAIVSIGAYAFDFSVEFRSDFHIGVDLVSCEKAGLSVEADTVTWWLKQSPEAIGQLNILQKVSISDALVRFAHFIGMVDVIANGNPVYIWGNSSSFDNKILRNAYSKTKIPIPEFKDMDYRTIKTMSKQFGLPDVETFREDGVKHDALSDAKTQAHHLISVLKKWK